MEDVYTATLLHYFNCQLDQILQDTRKNLGTIFLNFKVLYNFIALDLSRILSVLNLRYNKFSSKFSLLHGFDYTHVQYLVI